MIRNCLKCGKPFESQHNGNRLCGLCRQLNNRSVFNPPSSRQGRVIKRRGGLVKDGFGDRADE